MSTPTSSAPHLKSEPNGYPAIVEKGCVYTVVELCKRLRWKSHSLRQAKRLGMPVIRFGSRDYCISDQFIDWFEQIGRQQAEEFAEQ